MRRSEYDTFLIGFVIGACAPVLSFIIIEQIFNLLENMNLVAENEGLTSARRERSMYLFSIVACVIPVQILQKKKWDYALRGMMIPIFLYIAMWLFQYGSYLMAHF